MAELATKTESYELPSKGLIYGKTFDPHITLRSMTTMDELVRLSSTNTPYKQLSTLIEGCIVDKLPISVYDMHIGDFEFLLQKLRVTTYGPEYATKQICPACGAIIEGEYNLDSLKVNDFNPEEFSKLLTIELKKSGKRVHLHFQTPRILDKISLDANEYRKKFPDQAKIPYEIVTTLIQAIDTVDGIELGYIEKEEFAKNLPGDDMNIILNRIQTLNSMVGLDTRVNITCTKCGYDISTFFRTEQEFFRPYSK